MSCGHLRIFHAKGMPEGEYEESIEMCPYCRIENLEATLHDVKSALKTKDYEEAMNLIDDEILTPAETKGEHG